MLIVKISMTYIAHLNSDLYHLRHKEKMFRNENIHLLLNFTFLSSKLWLANWALYKSYRSGGKISKYKQNLCNFLNIFLQNQI